ncbi:MAG: hypothetical protein KatS3mg008_1888 [Acidimicrobiales bacterium]|nr:MAG: hypothetical protein KatS3mg008_1888 [Acidimicrobiales bacterium]
MGSLTVELARVCREVVAIESDPALIPALRETCGDLPVEIVQADAMRVDWDSLLVGEGRWVLVANLPYNIAIPLVVEIACRHPQVDRMLVMVQREAAARLAARPGEEAYGLPSLKLSYHAEARVVSAVPRTVFYPRPRVDSALLSVVRRPSPAACCPPEVIFALASRAFAQRRKMLRRSLAAVVGEDVFRRAEVDSRNRPEELGVPEWERLAREAGAVLLRAPAKLTVELRVTGVRGDGYHEIDAEMVTVDLADELVVVPGGRGLEVVGPHGAGTPKGAENLVSRALSLAGAEAWVHLDKRIPAGAGLGGGSADAAAVLRWAGIRDPDAALVLGADVPFCLVGGRARVRGVGEVVEPLSHEERIFTLLTPAAALRHLGRVPHLGRAGRTPRGGNQRPGACRPGRIPRAGRVAGAPASGDG